MEDTCWSRRFNISRSPRRAKCSPPNTKRRWEYRTDVPPRLFGGLHPAADRTSHPGETVRRGWWRVHGRRREPPREPQEGVRSVAKCELERPPLLRANHRSGGRPSTVRSARSRRAPRSLAPKGASRPRRHLRALVSRARRPRRGLRAARCPALRPRRRFRAPNSHSRRPWRRFEPGVGFRAARKPAAATGGSALPARSPRQMPPVVTPPPGSRSRPLNGPARLPGARFAR